MGCLVPWLCLYPLGKSDPLRRRRGMPQEDRVDRRTLDRGHASRHSKGHPNNSRNAPGRNQSSADTIHLLTIPAQRRQIYLRNGIPRPLAFSRHRRTDHAEHALGRVQALDVGEIQCLCRLHQYLESAGLCGAGCAGYDCFEGEGCSWAGMVGACSSE